jgi:hypothetical protein
VDNKQHASKYNNESNQCSKPLCPEEPVLPQLFFNITATGKGKGGCKSTEYYHNDARKHRIPVFWQRHMTRGKMDAG